MPLNQFISVNKALFIDELMEFLRIPSISVDDKYTESISQAATWVKDCLVKAGIDLVEVHNTNRHPIVYGEKIIDSDAPTILIYGHYDVQPADPYDLWDSPPFDPVIRKTPSHPDGAIFARGSADDKGQVYMQIKAIEAMIKTGTLSCNVKFIIEGEEEIGSNSLYPFIKKNKEKLKADTILVSDTSMISLDAPSVTMALRGLTYMEVEVKGPNRDLHSGIYGGAVGNPITILCKMIDSLTDDQGLINIPGFYDKVKIRNGEFRRKLNAVPFDETKFKHDLGVEELVGENGYTTIERPGIRPALDVNGIWGGYTGEGSKTVIPSKAFAKISMRLVPDQDFIEIAGLFEKHFKAIAPKSVQVNVKFLYGGQPIEVPVETIGYKAAEAAIKEVFGKETIPTCFGGTIPIAALFQEELGLEPVFLGFGLESDAIHSPNEHFGIKNFLLGIETIAAFFKCFKENF
jgi:acetylornithine deacetylase/succinyl-diaminopimelate desuccinylase-like protein